MAGKLRMREVVFAYLKNNAGAKFTALQIAEWIFATYPAECEEKRRRSARNLDDISLVQQLVAEIGAHRPEMQKKHPQIKITEERPRKYYYSEQAADAEVVQAEAGQKEEGAHDLYPMLMQYLRNEFSVFSMRIDEKKSSNSRGPKGNHWLHPDVVGMEDFGADWDREVRDCVHEYFDKRTRLWSFEVKLLLNGSNVRECYFQALSNSSWANLAYLVARDIEGTDTMKELRLLSAAHGIGLIKLNVEDPSEMNRLAKENRDFKGFVKRIRRFYQTGETTAADWGLPEVDD